MLFAVVIASIFEASSVAVCATELSEVIQNIQLSIVSGDLITMNTLHVRSYFLSHEMVMFRANNEKFVTVIYSDITQRYI